MKIVTKNHTKKKAFYKGMTIFYSFLNYKEIPLLCECHSPVIPRLKALMQKFMRILPITSLKLKLKTSPLAY